MKKLWILAVSCIGWAGCQQAARTGGTTVSAAGTGTADIALTRDREHSPVFSATDTLHDFGTIQQGDVVGYAFKFKNTGKKDLIITYASSTCGCTVADFPKEPVPPGAEGFVKVRFNSAGKTGHQEKPIFILANTQPPQINLKITCNVVNKN